MKIYYSMVFSLVIFGTAFSIQAMTIRCSGHIISPGDSAKKVLESCGEPVAREGGNWLYQPPNAIPYVVNVNPMGVVQSIRGLEESGAFKDHPMGDRP